MILVPRDAKKRIEAAKQEKEEKKAAKKKVKE